MLAGTLFALDGGDLNVGGGHVGLGKELAPCGADADQLIGLRRFQFGEAKACDRPWAEIWSLDLSGG